TKPKFLVRNLTKNQIRLQYSGFIIFAAKMLSIGTGLIFQLMIARTTSTEEYGLWFNINDVLAYFTLLAGVLPFWTMRSVARGTEGAAKTGIFANLIISAIAMSVYLPLIPFITSSLGISKAYLLPYFLMSMQIIELYLINALQACLQATIPQTLGYGLLSTEICKVALGYVLIIQFRQPILGAVISLIVALAVQITYYIKILRGEFKQKAEWKYVKEWIKGSVANIYNVIGNQIAALIFIMLFTYGGWEARGYFGAAAQIANIITYSSFLAFALHPKLLIERKTEDVTTSLETVLMFAIPMTAGVIALPDSYLTILQEAYVDSKPVLVVLAIDALIATTSTIFSSVVYGFEKVDEKAEISFKQLAKSRLFFAFSLPYFHFLITLPTSYYVLTTYTRNQPLTAAFCVSIINSLARFTMFLVLYAVVHKMSKIVIPWKNIAKYVFASSIMATVLLILPHPTRIYSTLIVTAIGGIIYLTLLMAIDREARSLAHSVWTEIKFKVKGEVKIDFS
ncbi:MAG: hypothetical protein QXH37_07610, partial [Candidatus Bathyarchaeia archaeon]